VFLIKSKELEHLSYVSFSLPSREPVPSQPAQPHQ